MRGWRRWWWWQRWWPWWFIKTEWVTLILMLRLLLRILHCLTSFNCPQIQVWGASQLDLREQSHLPRCQPFMVHIWAQSLSIVGLSDKSSHRKNFEASLFLFEVMMMDICCWWWGWWPWWIWRNKVSLSSLLFNVGGLIIELLDQWNS